MEPAKIVHVSTKDTGPKTWDLFGIFGTDEKHAIVVLDNGKTGNALGGTESEAISNAIKHAHSK